MPYAMTQIQKRPSISEDMEPDIKFLVFAHHHNLLDGIEKAVNTSKASNQTWDAGIHA